MLDVLAKISLQIFLFKLAFRNIFCTSVFFASHPTCSAGLLDLPFCTSAMHGEAVFSACVATTAVLGSKKPLGELAGRSATALDETPAF
jgi:hypothetical protein